MKTDKETKGCVVSSILYLLFISIIIAGIFCLKFWNEKNPTEFCDNLEQEFISEHNVKICKLRYPVLNFKEVKELKEENKKLEDKNFNLEDKLESIEIYLKRLESSVNDIKTELHND